MPALAVTSVTHILCRNYATAKAQADELVALADEKGVPLWKALGMKVQGCLLAMTGKPSDAVPMIPPASLWRSTGSTSHATMHLSYLTIAYADLGKFDDARRSIGEATTALETTKETWCEAEVRRVAGEIALCH